MKKAGWMLIFVFLFGLNTAKADEKFRFDFNFLHQGFGSRQSFNSKENETKQENVNRSLILISEWRAKPRLTLGLKVDLTNFAANSLGRSAPDNSSSLSVKGHLKQYAFYGQTRLFPGVFKGTAVNVGMTVFQTGQSAVFEKASDAKEMTDFYSTAYGLLLGAAYRRQAGRLEFELSVELYPRLIRRDTFDVFWPDSGFPASQQEGSGYSRGYEVDLRLSYAFFKKERTALMISGGYNYHSLHSSGGLFSRDFKRDGDKRISLGVGLRLF